MSILYISKDGRCVGWMGLEDRIRPDAKEATQELKTLGLKHLVILTGDRKDVAEKVGEELGSTHVEAECLPDRKLELVNEMKDRGYKVAVVGDGINDAPALAAGDIGIGMGVAGSSVAIDSASIALMSNDLKRLPFLIKLSQHTNHVIIQNIFYGMLLVVSGLIFSGLGKISPVSASILHVTGTVIVTFNSARLVRFGEELSSPKEEE